MKYFLPFTLISTLVLTGCDRETAPGVTPIEYTRLGENTWMYTGHMIISGYQQFPLNGVVAIDDGEAVVVDLPANRRDTETLFDWIEQKGAVVRYAVPLHFHRDSAGGLPVAYERGARVVMLDKTLALLGEAGAGSPDIVFGQKVVLTYGKRRLELAHYGGGHSADSVVAWLADRRLLVGGCLVKASDAPSLGNVDDADMQSYPATLRAINEAYPEVQLVTPGHGAAGGPELLSHTLRLAEAEQ